MAVVFRIDNRARRPCSLPCATKRPIFPPFFVVSLSWFLFRRASHSGKKERGLKNQRGKDDVAKKRRGPPGGVAVSVTAGADNNTKKKGERVTGTMTTARAIHGSAPGRNGASRGVVRSEGKIPRKKEARRHASATKRLAWRLSLSRRPPASTLTGPPTPRTDKQAKGGKGKRR